ncbi:hypothetical protein LCGC14_3048020, partial [marine sediment metagenome]
MQFYATSCFDSEEETPSAAWKTIVSQIAEFNEDERFTAFLGLQWLGTLKEEGLRELIFTKDNKNILRKKDLRSNSLKKIYKTLSSKDLLAIPSFTMGSESVYDFKDFNEEFEKVVEIYNAWGSSEMSSKEGNLRPISGPVKENPEGSIQKALLSGCRFGFVAGGLDDRGIYSKFFDSNQKQYSQGLSAIIAKDQKFSGILFGLRHGKGSSVRELMCSMNIKTLACDPMKTFLISNPMRNGVSRLDYVWDSYISQTYPLSNIGIFYLINNTSVAALQVSITDSSSLYAASNVEDALSEVMTNLNT